jgi:photosystem II stability/assembly factor-like uncharacterized protein
LLRIPGFVDVTPPSLPGWIDDVEFLDRQTGWLAASDCGRAKGAIVRTDDAGRTWQPLTTRFMHSCAAGARLDLSFVDTRNGWLVWVEPTGPFAEVYRTRDGGSSWRQIVGRRSPVDQVVFASPSVGWGGVLGWGPGPLLRTTDGGRSWERDRRLPVGRYELPILFGRHGVVAVAVRWSVLVYSTADAGRSWHRAGRLRFGGPLRGPTLSSPAPSVWWVAARSGRRAFFAVTSDEGRTWTRSVVDLPGPTFSLVATSARHALASGGGRLFRTADRGRTWQRVRPR